MAKTANLYARIEPEVKDQAESILVCFTNRSSSSAESLLR